MASGATTPNGQLFTLEHILFHTCIFCFLDSLAGLQKVCTNLGRQELLELKETYLKDISNK